jgi:hypothetical protein
MIEEYQYRPLAALQAIRVLELEPALLENSPLKGRLIDIDLELDLSQRRDYDALSYVWGYSKGDQRIICENKQVLVTQNCDSALRQLRSKTRKRRIWVDAICINQEDVNDRNHQVDMMDLVYKKAKRVHIWLGANSTSEKVLWTKFCFVMTDVGLLIKSLPFYEFIESMMDWFVQVLFDFSKQYHHLSLDISLTI